jgi:diguanylate cyclase (GGDEF)-like protein/PAS domain S-box-containing protein
MATWDLWLNGAIAAGWLAVAVITLFGLHLTRDRPQLRLPLSLLSAAGLILSATAVDPTRAVIAAYLDPRMAELIAVAMLAGCFFLLPSYWRRSADRARSLAEAEASYRSPFEHSDDGLYQTLPDGRVLRANTAFARILGFESAQALMDADLNVAAGIYVVESRRREFMDAVAIRGKVEDFESQILRRDGTVIWVSESAHAVRDRSGLLVCVEGKVTDVTPRKRAEEQRDRVFTLANDMLCLVRRNGRIERINPAFERVLGYEEAELLGRPLVDLFHADDALAATVEFVKVGQGLPMVNFAARCRTKDGGFRSLSWTLMPVGDRAQAVARDLTERRSVEEQLRLATTVFETAGEAIIVTDPRQRILKVNHAFTAITGFREDEVAGHTLRILSSGRHEPGFYEAMASMLETTGHWQGEVWNRRKNGELCVEWLSFAAVRDGDGRVVNFVGVFSDMTRHKQDEERIRHQANYDALTQLPNRWLFQARLGQALDRARLSGNRLALLTINVNQFKVVNDSLGHRAGDELLKELARRFLGVVRQGDTVARLGGDEFAVIVEDFRGDEPIEVLPERILRATAEPARLEGGELVAGVSIGIALYPGDGADAEALARNAATAMRHAREQRASAFRFFDDRMETRALERLKLEFRLRRALEKGEFEVHYQPQVDIQSRTLIGAEALIRWNDPELGPVSPAMFIPVAESSGLIVAIGQWVLREVCRQIVTWTAAGHVVPRIAVNLSFLQFRRPDFLATVTSILKESGVTGERLEFELTESVVMHDADQAIATLTQLRALGIELAIDDFGTGYSSLNRLRRMPIQTLKIDRSFISEVTQNADDAAIVSTILSMAHSLNLKVVAEGVETEAQLAFLADRCCDAAQGYLLSRPIAADRFARLLDERDTKRTAAAD